MEPTAEIFSLEQRTTTKEFSLGIDVHFHGHQCLLARAPVLETGVFESLLTTSQLYNAQRT